MHTLTLTFQNSDQKTGESFNLELQNLELTVKELISYSVISYISELKLKQKLSAQNCLEILNRRFLNNEEIRLLKDKGKVAMPETPQELKVDNNKEVEKALGAFDKQVFFLLIDGTQYTNLEEKINLTDNSKIFFLRIIALTGG